MKCASLGILAVLATLATVSLARPEDDYYKVKNSVNLDEVLRSDRLLTNYFSCLTDKGTCTAAGLQLKRIIPDALKTKCKKCSPKQKDATLKAIKHLSEKKPEMWKELETKFDPEGKFRASAKNDPAIIKYNIKF